MMEPSIRRVSRKKAVRSPKKRIIDLEQRMHTELLDRLNLRVTSQGGGADQQHVGMIKRHRVGIIE